MPNIKRILLPVDFPVASLVVLHQAATLAHHFNSEIMLLHVLTATSHAAGAPEDSHGAAGWDLLPVILEQAQKQDDPSLAVELGGLTVQRKLADGDIATAIVKTAEEENIDLIMMPSYSFTFYQFLLGSVTAKVLHTTECPVWTGGHTKELLANKFSIRSVLCSVDFDPRSALPVSWAALMATEFGARLTLTHVTATAEIWGPGGNYVDQRMKKELVESASAQMAELQQVTGVKADTFIGSGDEPTVLRQIADQTKADLLVNGCYPYGGHLRTHGYGIICAVPIPVLSV